jgi:hypothetical protein
LACYYCLATDIKPWEDLEFTGGASALAICPRCGVDSLVHKDSVYSWPRLMNIHITHFHFASAVDCPNEPISCNMASCAKWNEYVKEIYNEESDN